jgi:sugar phosphate isomerase/epimerase
MMELAEAIGTGNVGLLLDAWHLYTSGDPIDVLDTITARDVVTVHVNDAPQGLTLETYQDNDRRLPMETGVIDLPGFIKKLAAMGYDGPVTPEPFSKRINELAAKDTMAAGKLIADYMDKLWRAAGV